MPRTDEGFRPYVIQGGLLDPRVRPVARLFDVPGGPRVLAFRRGHNDWIMSIGTDGRTGVAADRLGLPHLAVLLDDIVLYDHSAGQQAGVFTVGGHLLTPSGDRAW
jgi:hypothetical protein